MENEQCPICNSKKSNLFTRVYDNEYKTDTKIYNIIKCTNCDILYISPIPLDLSKIYPDNYYSYSKGNQGIIYKIKNLIDILFYKRLLKIINKRDDISILDIGGGNGSILNIFKKITKKVCKTKIIDISESSKKEAEEHGHTFFCGRVEEYFSEEKFDIILLLNLIEHLPNPLDILSKCKNLLNDNGIIVIQTPNYESLDCKLFRNFNWAGFHTPRHFILFNEKSIKKIAYNLNLECNYFSFIQGTPFWALSTLFIIERIGFIDITNQKPANKFYLFNILISIFAPFEYFRSFLFKTSQMRIVLKKSNLNNH